MQAESSPKASQSASTQQNKLFLVPQNYQKFGHYFDSQLSNPKQPNKSSRATSSTQYLTTFEQYAKPTSNMDSILTVFDNGSISQYYQSSQQLVSPSTALLALPIKIQNNLATINSFFHPKMIGRADLQQIAPLYLENYVSYLSVITIPPNPFTKEQEIMVLETKESQIFRELQLEEVEANPPTDKSKIELLLAQIYFQKRWKENNERYIPTMEIKLDEFISYVLEDDDRYLGLSLMDKLREISANLDEYRGKMLQGWLKIVLIEIFFEEFKELQLFRLSMLKLKKEEKHCEVFSQMEKLSARSPSIKGQYSEPNSRRNREDQWIGFIE